MTGGGSLDHGQLQALETLWRRHLTRGDGAQELLRGGLQGSLPGVWRDPARLTLSLLDPWRDAQAALLAPQLLRRLMGQVVRADRASLRHPDSPAQSPWAKALRAGELPEPAELRGADSADARALLELLREGRELTQLQQLFAAQVSAWRRAFLLDALHLVGLELEQKRLAVTRIGRALGLSLASVGLGADWSAGFLEEAAWAELEALSELVQANPELRRLAEELGRFEGASQQLRRQETQGAPRSGARRAGRSEVRGLGLGGDLERVVPAELALFALPEAEALQHLRLSERRLLSYALDAPADTPLKRLELRPEGQGAGPVLLCLDSSASMSGEPERVAKALSLAVLRVALRQGRPCRALLFSGDGDLLDLNLSAMPQAAPSLIRMLASRFHGGTEPLPALEAALAHLPGQPRADLLLVTDGVFALRPELGQRVQRARESHGLRAHVLVLGDARRAHALDFADACWWWRPGARFEDGAVQLVGGLGAEDRGARDQSRTTSQPASRNRGRGSR